MGDKLVECPKCGQHNESATETCSRCSIDLAWALEHWDEVVSGPQEYDASLILVVDDEIGALTLTGIMVARAGYRYARAQDAYEALDLIPRILPDLIITDVMMPSMDGMELIRHLKASPNTQKIPVFILDARDDPESIRQGFEAGAVKYLTKPILHHDLVGAVTSFLQDWPIILFWQGEMSHALSGPLYARHICASWRDPSNFIVEAKALKPDFIVLPFQVGVTNGLDVLAQLKADPELSSIPVVMVAEHPEPDLEQRALEQGAYAVYTGPLDADKLIAMLPPLPAHE